MTHRLLWLTDVHFDHLTEWEHDPYGGLSSARKVLSETQVQRFCEKVMAQNPDSVVITGDISQAHMLEIHLMWLETYLPGIPIRFVLGNHDYYNGSIAKVRKKIAKYDGTKTRTGWLNQMGVVPLTEKTALVGHDGWYDGGYSDWFQSKLIMNEYILTEDFRGEMPTVVHKRIRELAYQSQVHIEKFVHEAAKTYPNVVFATHVPPFRENSRAPDRSLSNPDWLPNMSSKMAGDALLKAAEAFPEVQFTALSGHTHTGWKHTPRPNLVSLTGQADYGRPEVSLRVIEVE